MIAALGSAPHAEALGVRAVTLLAIHNLIRSDDPVRLRDIAAAVGRTNRAIQSHIIDLRGYGAIASERASRGFRFAVRPPSSWCVNVGDLVLQHQSLVISLAKKLSRFLPRWIPLDDHIQNGQIGLLQAAEKFDPGRGIPFGGFAYRRIQGAILDASTKRHYTAEMHEELQPWHAEKPYVDRTADDRIEQRERSQLLNTALNQLDPFDRAACLTHLTGQSLTEFAEEQGLSNKGRACIKRQEAMKRLRAVIKNMGVEADDFMDG